jgi:uridine kinase
MHRRYRFENFESPEETFIISPAEIILAEGLFVFEFAEIDALLDYRIFIDTDLVESLNRRLLRDETERGIQPDKSLYQWQNHVIPAYEKFILPHKKRCDLLLDGKDLPDNNLAKFREMI